MKLHRRSLALTLVVAAGIGTARPAYAWKPTTHQIVAVEGAKRLPENSSLRSTLLANERYLRGGSMGPDMFYAVPSYWQYADLAHYCETNELAGNMIRLAQTDASKAFAYGWLSHNVGDSVAHPWVNGFTGQPYEFWLPFDAENALLNTAHMKIESWVDAKVFSRGKFDMVGRARDARSVIDAFGPYFEPEIQDLMISAYQKTYEQRKCERKFETLTPKAITTSAQMMRGIFGAKKLGAIAPDILDLGAQTMKRPSLVTGIATT